MKIRNMTGSSGREVANQFIIEDDHARWFQSYSTTIAKRSYPGGTVLDPMWDCSVTTRRYLAQFLGDEGSGFMKRTQAKIDAGEYTVADLNA